MRETGIWGGGGPIKQSLVLYGDASATPPLSVEMVGDGAGEGGWYAEEILHESAVDRFMYLRGCLNMEVFSVTGERNHMHRGGRMKAPEVLVVWGGRQCPRTERG